MNLAQTIITVVFVVFLGFISIAAYDKHRIKKDKD